MAYVKIDTKDISKQMSLGIKQGLEEFNTIVAKESSGEAPLDEGTLRSSLLVTITDNETTISYNTNYALYMHEGISWQSGNKLNYQRGKKAKYLEDPFRRHQNELPNMLKKHIKI